MNALANQNEASTVAPWRLWFGLVVPVLAWGVHSSVSYYLTMEACHVPHPNLGLMRGVMIALAAVALGSAMAGVLIAFRSWRTLCGQRKLLEGEGFGRPEAMALGGIFVSASMTLGIAWAALPPILLARHLCEAWR